MKRSVLPGFRLTLGYTLVYLTLLVLIPLLTLPCGRRVPWDQLRRDDHRSARRRVVSAEHRRLVCRRVRQRRCSGSSSPGCSSAIRFPAAVFIDSLVDLPFALPTAVAGITLTTLCAPNGWIGQFAEPYGVKLAFSRAGVTIALIFIGLPFVVRTLQPVIEDLDTEIEEAATSLGATRLKVLTRVILPYLYPAWLTGFALAFARAVGEYRLGGVHLRQHADAHGNLATPDHHQAGAVRLRRGDGDRGVMLLISFVMLAGDQCAAGLDDAAGGWLIWPVTSALTGALWRSRGHGG